MKNLKTDRILTKAETRIAVGYVEGKIGKEIAAENRISYNTVVRHTQNIYDKTGIRRSTNAIVGWFLSMNYDIDVSELKRSIVAVFLLLVVLPQTMHPDFANCPVRQFSARRVVTRTAQSRSRRRDDTYEIS